MHSISASPTAKLVTSHQYHLHTKHNIPTTTILSNSDSKSQIQTSTTPFVKSKTNQSTSELRTAVSNTFDDNNSSIPPHIAAQMDHDIEQELLNISTTPSPKEPFEDAADRLITDSALSQGLDLEKKIDTLLTVQRLSIKSNETISKHLQSIESRLLTIIIGVQSLYTCVCKMPKYDQLFSKIMDLFGHTLRSIESLDSKLNSISSALPPQNVLFSGISFASDSSDDLPRNVINANLATISNISRIIPPKNHSRSIPHQILPPLLLMSQPPSTSLSLTS